MTTHELARLLLAMPVLDVDLLSDDYQAELVAKNPTVAYCDNTGSMIDDDGNEITASTPDAQKIALLKG